MGTTVIDQLVVTLGLDPKNFTKGQREALKKFKDSKEQLKKDSDSIGKSMEAAAFKVAGLFLSFEGAKKFVGWLSNINDGMAALGRFSRNVGTASHEVNKWGQAVALAGGSAEDAQASILQLSQDITKFQMMGEASPLLALLNYLDIALYDQQGNVRKLTDLYSDLGDHLSRMNRRDAFNLGQMAGLSEGTLTFLVLEKAKREELLAIAEKANRVTDAATKKAQDLQTEWRSVGQTFRDVGRQITEHLEPALLSYAKALAEMLDESIGKDSAGAESRRRNAIDKYRPHAEAARPALGATTSVSRNKFNAAFATAEQKYKLPAGLLGAVAQTESKGDIHAVSPAGAVGLMQLMPKYFPGAGKKPEDDIDTAAKYLSQLIAKYGSVKLALQAYNVGPGALDKILAGTRGTPSETVAYPGRVFGALDAARSANAAGGSTNKTEIGSITVNTAATDADGIASDIGDAIARKNLAAQADTGQQ